MLSTSLGSLGFHQSGSPLKASSTQVSSAGLSLIPQGLFATLSSSSTDTTYPDSSSFPLHGPSMPGIDTGGASVPQPRPRRAPRSLTRSRNSWKLNRPSTSLP